MDNKKLEIVKIANRLFSEKGYSNTSVDEIAKECGMAKASLYKIFGSKEELLLESMLQFSSRVESGLKQFADNSGLSPRERLHECAQIYLEAVCDNNIHLLMLSYADVVAFTNDSIMDVCFMVENSFNMWLTECLVYIYGDEIKSFALDVAFIVRSVVSEYVRMLGPRVSVLSAVNYKLFISFIESIIDICVCGIMEKKDEYVPLWNISEMIEHNGDISPLMKLTAAKKIIIAMESTIGGSPLPEEEKKEYYQILLQLKEETPSPRAGSGLLKAYTLYLEQLPELRENCKKLRSLYDL